MLAHNRSSALVGFLLATLVSQIALAATHQVTIKDQKFSPAAITIQPGDTVIWLNTDERDHTVKADDGSFVSGNLGTGQQFSFKFTKAGKFSYSCAYHPREKGLVSVGK